VIGRRGFVTSGGAAVIGTLAYPPHKEEEASIHTPVPQAGDVILYSGGPHSATVVGVLRPLTKIETAAWTGGAAAVWTTSFDGAPGDQQCVLVSDVLAIVPVQWRKSRDLGAAIGLPNPNLPFPPGRSTRCTAAQNSLPGLILPSANRGMLL
jgi:hypothetical protein